ncbi:hypothetical protein F2P56_024595 [Juglans regia]|uniref:RNase H type-1 domain-containing protein n=2 Tax=Juglans regia TaxID=51240 RepID=A0A833TUP7_JUGRE|nr:uncharacterized protein LOC109018035 [Juglans regia]KAF5454970.1 hypothetical protein F2P56_024595 [Juglans regia]
MIQKWRPPGKNCFKANWDVAFDIKQRKMGIEIIIRDDKGEVMAAYCGSKGNVEQPSTAKCFALRKAIELYSDLSLNKVILEGDAQIIVKAVNEPNEDLSFYGSIIEDLKLFLITCSNWTMQYTNRNTNVVAHNLAKADIQSNVEKIWVEEAPVFISSCLHKDKEGIVDIVL